MLAAAQFMAAAARAAGESSLLADIRRAAGERLCGVWLFDEGLRHLFALAESAPHDAALVELLLDACESAGDIAAETRALRMLLACDPHRIEGHRRLAELLLDADSAAAISHLEVMAAAFPADARIWRQLAHLYRRLADGDGEMNALSRIALLEADSLDVRRRLADLSWSRGEYDRALPHLEIVARLPDAPREMWRRIAAARARSGDVQGEAAALRRAYRHDAHKLSAHRRIAAFYLDRRAPHRALPHLRVAIALKPKDTRLLEQAARAHRMLDRPREETAILEALIGAGSTDRAVILRLCTLLAEARRPSCIVRLVRQSARGSEDAELSRFLAAALEETEAEPSEIIAAWQSVVAGDDEDLDAHEHLARLLTAAERWREAAAHLERIAKARPDDRDIAQSLAAAVERFGAPAERVSAWTNLLRLDTASLKACERLASLLEADDPAAAIAHLAVLAAATPSDGGVLRRLADARRAVGDIDGEITERQKLVALDSLDLRQHQRLAEIYLARNDALYAAHHLDQLEKCGGGDRSAWVRLARLQTAGGDKAGAADAWRRAASHGQLDAPSCVEAASACLAAARPGEAIVFLGEALEASPGDCAILRKLAKACRAAGRADAELDALKEILRIAPKDRRAIRRIGELLYSEKRFVEAAPYLDRALEFAPRSAALARRCATAARMAGDPGREAEAWRLVLRTRPDDVDAHRRIGDILFGQSKYLEAAPHLVRVVEAEPTNDRLCRRLVKAYRRAGDAPGEARALRKLTALSPADSDSRLRLAELLEAQGEPSEAVALLESLDTTAVDEAAALRLLAEGYRRLGRRDDEFACLSKLLQLDPASASPHLRCGEILFERKAYREAEPHLRRAAEAYPGDAGVLRSLATCLAALGRGREEANVLKRLVELDEQDLESRTRLGVLLVADGAMAEAVSQLRPCLAWGDNDIDALQAFATALSTLEPGGEESVAAWSRLRELAPYEVRARRGLADALYAAGRYAEAEQLYAAMTAEDPCDAELWRRRIGIARALEQPAREIEFLRLAAAENPDCAEFSYGLAARLIEWNSPDRVDSLRAAWRNSPDPSLHAAAAKKLAESGETDTALAEFSFLVHEAPHAFSGWLELGEIASRMGRHRLAATYFGKAYQLSGESSHCKRWIGSLLEARAFEIVDSNCSALSGKSLGDKNMRMQHARALAGLERFEEALRIAETCIEAGEGAGGEGFLHYLRVRIRMKAGNAAAAASPGVQLFQRAEERQAIGDLRGAAQIYRNGGAALRRCFVQRTVDGIEVLGPDFMIIGAPRSGSSWLKNCLKRHPQMRVAGGEPGYFSTRAHESPAVYARELAAVAAKPSSSKCEAQPALPVIFGEKTPEYLTIDDDAIELCAALYPNAKLICMIRDPVARAWSHLKHRRLAARSPEFYAPAGAHEPEWLGNILEFGRYERHLRRWARRFPRDRILLVDFERIVSEPHRLLGEVQEFLGVEQIDLSGLALSSPKFKGATATVGPTGPVAKFLADSYRGEAFDVGELRSAMAGALEEIGRSSKAA